MISDTLHDAINEIDEYLREDNVSAGSINLFRAIIATRDHMEVMRCRLDKDPAGYEPVFREYSDAKEVSE